MWTLRQVYAKNLCAFKQLDYTLLQKHTTLIFGNNMDNDSQGSNGSGKSAMLEAIAIGITGETLRRIKMDEIIMMRRMKRLFLFCFKTILQDSTYLLNVLSPVKQHR